jgi:hypothetical protein
MSVIHEAPIPSPASTRCFSCLVMFDADQAPRKMSARNVNDLGVWIYCPICDHPHTLEETRTS